MKRNQPRPDALSLVLCQMILYISDDPPLRPKPKPDESGTKVPRSHCLRWPVYDYPDATWITGRRLALRRGVGGITDSY